MVFTISSTEAQHTFVYRCGEDKEKFLEISVRHASVD
jgi:hypothetical protein